MNHEARRANHPSEYRPTPRVPKNIVANTTRTAYWCHLCCCSRLDSSGLDLHYKQAHPDQGRNASSRLYTTYLESRHGLMRETSASQQHNRGRNRPAAQRRSPRSSRTSNIMNETSLTHQQPTAPSSPTSWERGISANAPKSLSRAKRGGGGSASEEEDEDGVEGEDEHGDIPHDA